MTRKKYKLTGCARLFFVLIILIPAAYFGAKLIRGGEGIPAVDNLIESIFDTTDEKAKTIDQDISSSELYRLRKENEVLKERIQQLERALEEKN